MNSSFSIAGPAGNSDWSQMFSGMGGEYQDFGKLMLMKRMLVQEDRRARLETLPQELELIGQYQRKAALEANEMGIKNQIIGSFLKDVPAAIATAAGQRNRYAPEQIEIERAAMINRTPARAMPNYYSFVR